MFKKSSPFNNAFSNPENSVKKDTKIAATEVDVYKFYNGSDGFSLSIQNGNSSTCIWTWVGGNASIPYSQTTFANSATDKHVISFSYGTDSLFDFKVSCIDDFGNSYIGKFPES